MLYTSDWVSLGLWECPPESARWNEENTIGDRPVIALPWTSVVIDRPENRDALVNPNAAVFYAPGELYRRQIASKQGDRCAFINPSEELVREVQADLGVDAGSALFAVHVGAADEWSTAAHHALARAIKTGQAADPLFIEEQLTTMVCRTIRSACDAHGLTARPRRASTAAAHRDLAQNALSVITEAAMSPDSTDRLSIRDIADQVHASPYHLCRVFKAEIGETLASYTMRLRLAVAAESVAWSSEPVTTIAHRMAFSSHAHFTTSWKTAYGAPPSAFRRGPVPVPNTFPTNAT